MDDQDLGALKLIADMNRRTMEDLGRMRAEFEELKRVFTVVKTINEKLLAFLIEEAKATHDDLTSERIRQTVDRIHREMFPNKI